VTHALNQNFDELPVWVGPDRLSGVPCFLGTRCPLEAMFSNLQSGLSLDEFLDCFPEVTRGQAVAVLEHSKREFTLSVA
jgi:uncharacterized protein (DUF433 family)